VFGKLLVLRTYIFTWFLYEVMIIVHIYPTATNWYNLSMQGLALPWLLYIRIQCSVKLLWLLCLVWVSQLSSLACFGPLASCHKLGSLQNYLNFLKMGLWSFIFALHNEQTISFDACIVDVSSNCLPASNMLWVIN